MAASQPQAMAKPQVYFKFMDFTVPGIAHEGIPFEQFQFRAMLNGGYIIKCTLNDPHSTLLRALTEQGYFEKARVSPVAVKFQILAGPNGTFPTTATQMQLAYIVSLQSRGNGADEAILEFTGIDPPSWYLNAGDAAGSVFQGKVSDVIKQVVSKYAPGVTLNIGDTRDSDQNLWYMMRQDPKTFINSLLDWSSAITKDKTHWIVDPDGINMDLTIKEQSELQSNQRAYYRRATGGTDTVFSWKLLADNALSLSATKIVTAGLSAISGQYLDKITDSGEQQVFAEDDTTPNKQIADVDEGDSYTKPPTTPPPQGTDTVAGWTYVPAVPELYSAGDIGLSYSDYVDGRARQMYLNLTNMLFRIKLRVLGHGEWSDCTGLGVDTFYLRWQSTADQQPYFLNGNWLVYGFEHVVTRYDWFTDVYGARFDYKADAKTDGGD